MSAVLSLRWQGPGWGLEDASAPACRAVVDATVFEWEGILPGAEGSSAGGARDPRDALMVALRQCGRDLAARLSGEFAFALWSEEDQLLYAARDPLGARQLFYSWRPGVAFDCACDLGALLRTLGEVRANEDALLRHLVRLPRASGETFFRGVSSLPAGHWLELSPGGLRTVRYWEPGQGAASAPRSDADWIDAYRGALRAAVRDRGRAARRLAVELSGGLDSSSLSMLAGAVRSPAAPGPWVITASFPGDSALEEFAYSRAVAVAADLRQVVVSVTRERTSAPLEDRLRDCLEPDLVGAALLSEVTRRAAIDLGCDGLMTGYLGDLMGGGRWYCPTEGRGQPVILRLRSLFSDPRRIAVGLRSAARRARRRIIDAWRGVPVRGFDLGTYLSPALDDRLVALDGALHDGAPSVGSAFQGTAGFVARLRRADPDRAVTAHNRSSRGLGLVTLHPFLDRRVAELAALLPRHLRERDGTTRWVLREAMRGILPEPIRQRRSKAMATGFHEAWSRDLVLREVGPDPMARLGSAAAHLNLTAVVRDCHELARRPLGYLRTSALFRAVVVARWLGMLDRLGRGGS
ncbi:MAG: hypothetical protein JW751_29750 [Polyangiaceae bacterium]|nr:hypothetical protein [Polyangiaceae bacterium]